MTDKINDGGPAFPDPVAISPEGDVYPSNSCGMSLRDWFAAQALAGYCAVENCWSETPEEVARAAYAVADAMLAARDTK